MKTLYGKLKIILRQLTFYKIKCYHLLNNKVIQIQERNNLIQIINIIIFKSVHSKLIRHSVHNKILDL
jgi:hypothetical protein